MTAPIRKKLIEVSIPLEAINIASAKEKSIRHGHPSTLHLWWARRPLAACRAILFSQLVDDPSSWPDKFKTEEAQDVERRRLHKIIERMVSWEASNDTEILNEARFEIARSVAWGLGDDPPNPKDGQEILDFLQTKAPPVYDPFSGGGSIPLEAQRLGLRAYGSDLNPVAVLIGKALVEIPPKFARLSPVNPTTRKETLNGALRSWKGATGLAEDVRYYGNWIRDQAQKKLGHLYPKVELPDGSQATVIAWIWARTVRSPDPAAKGAMIPLISSFLLSAKGGIKSWVHPIIDNHAQDGYRFEIRSGALTKTEEERLKQGTKTGRGSNFSCLLTGAAISGDHVKAEGSAGRFGARLIAIVAEGSRKRIYVEPNPQHEAIALNLTPSWIPEGELPNDPRNFWTVAYGLKTFASLFTARQLVMLTTFTDLINELHDKVLNDSVEALRSPDPSPLHSGGIGAKAYADAVATYIALAISKLSVVQSSVGVWSVSMEQSIGAFGRQAIVMTWEFPESNVFNGAAGDIETTIQNMMRVLDAHPIGASGSIHNIDARKNSFPVRPIIISTDPPYYDNIGYADLSDFFYVWLRRSLWNIWPDLFRRLITPKAEELVATPYRHGGKENAEAFFMQGMCEALTAIRKASTNDQPLAIYYAFKQAEVVKDGITSAGWSSFLQAVVDAGLIIDGTWPVRTERNTGLKASVNALASSIVLVCRKQVSAASTVTRSEFIRTLKREMPAAIDKIRKAGVGPVDMPQSIIGPGMGVFTRYERVLEDDDSAMGVKTALALINRIWGEIENDLDANFDGETQVALAWFAAYGYESRASGDLITLANAKNIPSNSLFKSGVFEDLHGKTRITPREALSENWSPITDKTVTVWECVQHTARVLNADYGGAEAAAKLVAAMGGKATDARALAYRLYEIASQKSWASEALVYNELAQEWTHLEDVAGKFGAGGKQTVRTLDLFGEVAP
jgi:putative DNA methylase